MPQRPTSEPRRAAEWRSNVALAGFLVVATVVAIIFDLRFLASMFAVGGALLAFVGGYLFRADIVATGRRPPRWLTTRDDAGLHLESDEERARRATARPETRRRLATTMALGLAAGVAAGLFVSTFTGAIIAFAAVMIPGGTWLLVLLDERGRR